MFPQSTVSPRGRITSRVCRWTALRQLLPTPAVLFLGAFLSLGSSLLAIELSTNAPKQDSQPDKPSAVSSKTETDVDRQPGVVEVEVETRVEKVAQNKPASTKPSKLPPVDFTFNSFSSAFINVLQSIQEGNAKQRPTRAGSGDEKLPLEAFALKVEDKINIESKRTLDPATEVTPKSSNVEKQQPDPTPEKVQPSVAGPVGVDASKTAQQKIPLDDELDQYFEELESSPNQDPQASTSPATDSTGPKSTPKSNQSTPPAATPIEVEPIEPVTPNRVPPSEPDVHITQRMASLQPRVAKTLRFYFERPLNTGDDSAWSVMHSMLGYGPRGLLAIGGERGRRTNVVHWLCQNGLCANRRLLYLDKGYIKGLEGPGYQGHPGQFLAMLAQIGVERDFPLNVQGRKLTLDALVNSEMYTCSSSKELTFKLISLSYYLESNAKWKSENGEIWDLPKILSLEMAQPINGAACGGTHRVMSISYAVRNRWIRGEPNDGVYAQAEQYVRQYQQYALSLQNRDGSFSSEWFKRLATSRDRDRLLQTTGHILEWLVYTLPRNELSDPRIVSAVEFLTNLMTRHRFHDWEVGPRGHAIRALSLYHQRVFERRPATPQVANAEIWSTVVR